MKFTKNAKDSLNYIQSHLYPKLNNLTHGLSLPVRKFVKQMVYGIITSRSSIVQKVAGVQNEKISLKKTSERFYNNLKRKGLYSELSRNLLTINLKKVDELTPYFIDLSDINKKGAPKMEGISRVWDGSEGKANPGYFNLQASTCNPEENRKLKLLYSELFSIKRREEKDLIIIYAVLIMIIRKQN